MLQILECLILEIIYHWENNEMTDTNVHYYEKTNLILKNKIWLIMFII